MRKETRLSLELVDAIVAAADKFIAKCEDGRARSVETLEDLKTVRAEALILEVILKDDNERSVF